MRLNLSEKWWLDAARREEGYEIGAGNPLPPGVHLLSEESRIILGKAALRGQEIERRHLKRVP